ncbi:MAG: hypothetical protein JWO05_3302 [Gemmatimonadetes bacterium]|nr:hypothetical protein [Gemmatimonadota bacterium]
MQIAPIVLAPHDTGHAGVWVYRYEDPQGPWRLSIATHAQPNSGKLSLGGFRVAPEERTSSPGFDSDKEAIGLANGMEEKVYWSRLIGVGGPLARRDISRIVGGKCVMHPTPDARVGQPRDRALLDFAIASFKDCEARAGICITTGQDLGHGMLHDGTASSLEYLNARFSGSVVADTSKPTGEGNFRLLVGMLRGAGLDVARATVGLVGCGNIGMHLVERLRERGATILALESRAERRAELEALGVRTWTPEQKDEFLSQPMDAVCVNAAGNSLDPHAVGVIARNERLHVVCGSENLVMPDDAVGSEALRAAGKLYSPTELGGMMGYLTAVEEYLAHAEGVPFDVHTLFDAAEKLDEAGDRGVDRVLERKGKVRFEDAIREIYG